MSKEYLEALKRIKKSHHTAIAVMGCERDYETENAIDIIEKELQRLDNIDNAKPSEALEILDDLKNGLVNKETGMIMFNQVWFKNQIDTIKQYFLKAQEQEKVLEIIKEKNVDIIRIKHLIFKSQKNPKYWDLRYYNEARVIDDEKLTQEEFELLKRWLG